MVTDNLSTMKNTFEQGWKKAFAEYNTLPLEMKQGLRQIAVDKLLENGAEEIGSSDVNHALFGLWNTHNQNWTDVALEN